MNMLPQYHQQLMEKECPYCGFVSTSQNPKIYSVGQYLHDGRPCAKIIHYHMKRLLHETYPKDNGKYSTLTFILNY